MHTSSTSIDLVHGPVDLLLAGPFDFDKWAMHASMLLGGDSSARIVACPLARLYMLCQLNRLGPLHLNTLRVGSLCGFRLCYVQFFESARCS